MTRDPSGGLPPDGADPAERQPDPDGRLANTGAGAVVTALCVGLVAGWLVRRVASYLGSTAPLVTWTQSLVLFFGAAILAVVAWHTRRALDGTQPRPEPHRLVNRLVLARASAIAGALVAGGYLGYAVSWLGVSAELAGERAGRSMLAGLGGLMVLVSALLLERACRVRTSDDSP
ncbi:MAG: DUF3180 domain-containing protein [Nocardioides sp.]